MIVPAAHRLASLAPRMRQAILMLAALFVAHDAIYLARLGGGDGSARAMSAQGHDCGFHADPYPHSTAIRSAVSGFPITRR